MKPGRDRQQASGKLTIATICRRLKAIHGPVDPPQQLPVLDQLIATILSQHTSDSNSHRAFAQLQRSFSDWDAVRRARVSRIEKAIRSGGLAKQKAPRIKAILEHIHQQHGELSLEFIHDMRSAAALEHLQTYPGVGPKTAACVLLFACQMPVLPVDTHVHRVSKRLGLIENSTTAERAHDELGKLVRANRVLEFHVQLIRHGRRTCHARQPHCRDCVLLDGCAFGGCQQL